MSINDLAKEMGVTVADVAGFVECLRLWMAKGLSFEEAIGRHMKQMERLVNNATVLASDADIRKSVAGEIWDAVNA